MKHRYIPMTDKDHEEMLAAIGIATVDELFEDIPEKVRFKGELNIKPAKVRICFNERTSTACCEKCGCTYVCIFPWCWRV